MSRFMSGLSRFFSPVREWSIASFTDDEGQALVEYGLIIALVALVCIAVLTVVGTDVSSVFSSIASKL